MNNPLASWYMEFVQKISKPILKMIFDDKMNCLYDKPLAVVSDLYRFTTDESEAIANIKFGGNILIINIPKIFSKYVYNNPYDIVDGSDLIATDIVISIIHEAFHINQDIDLDRFKIDMNYKNNIENANTAASDRWLLDHIMQINRLVNMMHPYYYGLNLSRVLQEYNMTSTFLSDYHVQDMEQIITKKLKLIYPSAYDKFKLGENSKFDFIDNHEIITKYHGFYDCEQVNQSLVDFNKFLYAISLNVFRVVGKFLYDDNRNLNCQLNIDWNSIRRYTNFQQNW